MARNIILLLLATLLFWLLAGCESDTSPQTTIAEPAFELKIDMLGRTQTASLDNEGRLVTRAELASPDDKVLLFIDKGTQLLDGDGKPLSSIWVKTEQELLPLTEDAYIVGTVYSLEPQDATFNAPLELTLSYDPREIPEDVREDDVYIAPYDENTGWGSYSYKRVNTEKHQVTTQINQLTRYAVLAPIAPVPSQAAPVVPAQPSRIVSLKEALSNGQPTVAEFGRGVCIPCKAMKPILEELAVDYKGKLNVVIVEIDDHMDQTRQYGIMAIPTQIFFDSSGQEITRHMGFYAKEDIIAQLQEMGVE